MLVVVYLNVSCNASVEVNNRAEDNLMNLNLTEELVMKSRTNIKPPPGPVLKHKASVIFEDNLTNWDKQFDSLM